MSTTVQIAPAAGNAVISTQLGVGAAPGFDAIDDRRFWGVGKQEGVGPNPTAWKVTEGSLSTDMLVDVAANVDYALVQGDTIAHQGLYYVAPHATVATLTLDNADVTNPRIDQVILRVYDDAHDGSGNDFARLEVVAGTPTAGATKENGNGKGAVPNTAIVLARIQVDAGATGITNARILDVRHFALGLNAVVRVNSNLDVASNQTTFDTFAGAPSITVELSGAPVEVSLHGAEQTAAGSPSGPAGFRLFATPPAGGSNFCGQTGSLNSSGNARVAIVDSDDAPTPGRWTFAVQGASDGVRARQLIGATDPATLRVREFPGSETGSM